MTEDSIRQLLATFYSPDFGLQNAIDLVGPVADRSRKGFCVLAPQDSSITYSHLELLDGPPPGEPFFSGWVLRFRDPVPIDLAPLESRYGRPREMPRLHPDQPVPLQFLVPAGAGFEGAFILNVEQQAPASQRLLSQLVLQRYPRNR